ncbi:MAG: ribosome maturation factor RimM [Casimicrobiaceae bacterium]
MQTSPKRPERLESPGASPQSVAPPDGADASLRVVLGQVLGAFGIRGWIRVKNLAQDPESLMQQPVWRLSQRGVTRDVQIEEVKAHSGAILARLAGIDDRGAAEAMRGAEVTVARDLLPVAGPGEYYWTDLIGLSVRNVEHVELGRVAGLIEAPAHDVLRVASDEGESGQSREQLIPFVEPIVRAVDVAGGSITVDWQKDY